MRQKLLNVKYWLYDRYQLISFCREMRELQPFKDHLETAERLSWNLALTKPNYPAAIQKDMSDIVYFELTGSTDRRIAP